MKIFILILSMVAVSNSAFAANRCLGAASQIAQNFIVAGTSLKQVKHEATKDPQIEKYIATLQSNKNPSQIGYVVIVVSSRDCSEIMSIPGL